MVVVLLKFVVALCLYAFMYGSKFCVPVLAIKDCTQLSVVYNVLPSVEGIPSVDQNLQLPLTKCFLFWCPGHVLEEILKNTLYVSLFDDHTSS